MELTHYLSILWRRKWVIILTVAITMVVIVIGTQLQSPVYQASTILRIAASAGGQVYYSEYYYSELLMNTYVEIATSEPVLTELAKRLDVSQSPAVTAELIPTTELIKITAEDTNAKQAAMTANTLADILIDRSNQLYTGGGKTSQEVLEEQLGTAQTNLEQARKGYETLIIQTPAAPDKITLSNQLLEERQRTYETLLRQYEEAQYREAIAASMITVVETAVVPDTPSQPRAIVNYSLGAILGLFGGLILAFIFENMDGRLFTSREIEAETNAPILAKLPHAKKHQLDYANNKFSPLIESMRYLVARLQLDSKVPKKTLMLTSTEPGQGTSTISANLACLLAEQGKSVALVDCNLRNPKLHDLFGLSNDKGLADVLSEAVDWKNAIQKSPVDGVNVLTTGPVTGAPLQTFDPARTEKLIASLRQQFEYIVLDAPALSVADAAMLAPQTDGVILVARRSHTRRGSVQSASEFLSRLNGKFIGLVVNEAGAQEMLYA